MESRKLHPPAKLSLCFWLVVCAITFFSFPRADAQGDRKSYRTTAMIEFEGMITAGLEQYLYRKIEQAREQESDLLVLRIDSMGGELEASLNMARYLRNLDWAHTVAYIPRQAISGAAITALGCDEIVMHADAVMGDAGPIVMDFLDFGFRHAPEKVQSDLSRRLRDLAETGGRAPALAEAMCNNKLVVFRVRHLPTDEVDFKSEEELQASPEPDHWQKLNPVLESREGKFLEVSGLRAVELGLADAVVKDAMELKKRFPTTGGIIKFRWQFVDSTVALLNNPWLTGLLLIVGLLALIIEFWMPGIGVGGLVAALCFAIFFWSRFLGGTAGWLEVILFATGVVFLMVEMFVFPGFGLAGLGGTLLVFLSLILACQSFVIPQTDTQLNTLLQTLMVVVGSGAAVIAGSVAAGSYLGEIPVISRFVLQPPSTGDSIPEETPVSPLTDETSNPLNIKPLNPGDIGVSASPLRPAGVVRVGENYYDVVSEGTFIEEGKRVKVLRVSGNLVVVREIQDA
ncbi:MAG: hypothetical protein CMJ81_18515 [Planctomycetaceae bacterium]|nr:hypothetical protein [Planctomycetaceae bacterium]MBP61828.1 hypothetical protein [Planctomycetaceae bacterium]